jgi:hypothetical protein
MNNPWRGIVEIKLSGILKISCFSDTYTFHIEGVWYLDMPLIAKGH